MSLFDTTAYEQAPPPPPQFYVVCLDENENECFVYRDLHPVRPIKELAKLKPRRWKSLKAAQNWIKWNKSCYPYLKYSNYTPNEWTDTP